MALMHVSFVDVSFVMRRLSNVSFVDRFASACLLIFDFRWVSLNQGHIYHVLLNQGHMCRGVCVRHCIYGAGDGRHAR